MVVVKVGFRPLRRSEMDEDRADAPCLNLLADPGHIVQSLAAKRASKMTKENQQHRRLIHQLEQASAGLRPVLPKHRRHLLRVWIGHRQRHAHLKALGRVNHLDTSSGYLPRSAQTAILKQYATKRRGGFLPAVSSISSGEGFDEARTQETTASFLSYGSRAGYSPPLCSIISW